MCNHFFSKSFKCCFILFVFLRVGSLQAGNQTFDERASLPIARSFVEVYPPGESCQLEPSVRQFPGLAKFWCVRNLVEFGNGLYASRTYYYDDVSYREDLKKCRYSGNVNIILNEDKKERSDFAMLFENGKILPFDLWLDDSQGSGNFPRIISLTTYCDTISHWFYDEKKVGYIFGLSDGTFWKTLPQDLLGFPWDLSSRIISIGNASRPILINIDLVSEDYPLISSKDYLEVMSVK